MDDDAPVHMMRLQDDQVQVISALERTGASLSLVGVFLIIVTYAQFKRLRTVPNTFILFASVANIGASVACLIGYAGIEAGKDSNLCKAQAFLLEMFMQSDPWWSFAMAVNVFMVFFFSTNPNTFRRYLWIYCIICFGIPMIPAIVCLYVKNDFKGPVYGEATLWCWIGDDWNSLRIFSYYIPIWVCTFLSAIIYVAVGYHVFHQRNQLRNLSLSNQARDASSSDVRDSAEKALTHNLAGQPGFYGTVTTEVQVTTDVCYTMTPPPTPAPSAAGGLAAPTPAHCPWSDLGPEDEEAAPGSSGNGNPYDHSRSSQGHRAGFATISNISSPPRRPPRPAMARLRKAGRRFMCKLRRLDPVKLAYLRTSFVFAISVLVTWTPSSINRVYTLAHQKEISYGLNIASAAVLPLQGVWNAIIYFTTSWSALCDEVPALLFRSRLLRRLSAGTRLDGSGLAGRGRASHGVGKARMDHFERGRVARHCPADSVDMEMEVRMGCRAGTVRVQKGGELDN